MSGFTARARPPKNRPRRTSRARRADHSHDAAEVGLQHVNAANFGDRPRAHFRDRLEHQPFADAVAHLADQNLGDVLAFERRRAREQLAQCVELAVARMTPFDRGNLREFFVELANCQRRLGIRVAQLERHLDRLAEIFGGGEDVLALVRAVGHLGDDFPNCAAANLQALLLALLNRAPDHESRGDFGFIEVERGEERADLSAICSRL